MEEDVFVIDNLEVHKKDNFVTISINTKMYPLEVIYSTAYIFINRAYVLIEGDPTEEVLVQLRTKTGMDIETLGREFNNELLNYMVYMQRTSKSRSIREAILQRVLSTNSQVQTSKPILSPQPEKLYIEDPEKIAKPWKPKD